jgi:hypothetical protein
MSVMGYKKAIIVGSLVVTTVALFQAKIVNALLGLILTGTIPGTPYTLPFWVMMAFYCTIISLLVAWYVESLIVSRRMHKTTSKQRMPRRRYSHI